MGNVEYEFETLGHISNGMQFMTLSERHSKILTILLLLVQICLPLHQDATAKGVHAEHGKVEKHTNHKNIQSTLHTDIMKNYRVKAG